MKTWAWMLGGLIVWSIHFIGVYLISSVADVVATADDPAWRWGALAFSALCLLAAGGLLAIAGRRLARSSDAGVRFPDQIAGCGAGVAAIAIAWQALPTLVGY